MTSNGLPTCVLVASARISTDISCRSLNDVKIVLASLAREWHAPEI
jgi:hypothetical protein